MLNDVLRPRHRWALPPPLELSPSLRDAAATRGLSERLIGVLAARGVTSATELDAWFADPAAALHHPSLLPDAGRARERIARARSRSERVMVFGDFDADGVTGLAILVRTLGRLGIAADSYVPRRLEEGHGLSLGAIEAARASGTSLIVTVDCGSTSGAEIAAATASGIDVIVTDHHRLPTELPPAVAVVNPHRADSDYPDRRLTGAGVAFKVAALLLADEPGGPAFAAGLADLAMIGTVADVAPIVGENRAIARLGLGVIAGPVGPRAGIAALLARANVSAGAADLETVGFALAPRLNAAGRVGEAADAARLLVTDDRDEAAALATRLEAANLERRDQTKTAVAEARAALAGTVPAAGASPAAVVVRGAWPVGIVGLVAGRLAEELARPAVVGADLGAIVRASCRSDGTMNLAAALEACSDLLERHGGHAGAAGFEIVTDRWEAFRDRFLTIAASSPPADPRPVLRIDLVVPALDVGYALHRELAALAPCGPGNRDPLVAIRGLTVVRARVAGGGHSQVTLRRDRDVLDGIAFDWPELAGFVAEGDRIDVVGRLMSRTFAGLETLQVEIRDAAPSDGTDAEARAAVADTRLSGMPA